MVLHMGKLRHEMGGRSLCRITEGWAQLGRKYLAVTSHACCSGPPQSLAIPVGRGCSLSPESCTWILLCPWN